MTLNEDFIFQILSIVDEIPEGKVASYSLIADLAGCPKNARLVGKVLSLSEYYGRFPCHRVVNSQGRFVPGWDEQKSLLFKEEVNFKENGNVNMKKNLWEVG